MQWKTVYIFVSSTFNDMHAERDRLVKRVFPELRLWCAKRKLQLREIDLRWGVSAADAQENKRVVEVCLRNIDKCRPFFLCFMGQRRGWVPSLGDINPETLEAFPALDSYVGKASVTELEVIHALLHPLADSLSPVQHARFYFRSDSYSKSLDTPEHRDLFIPKRGFLRSSDKALETFKKQVSRHYPSVTYTAHWNPELPSPELTGVLAKGRLDDFRVQGTTLEADVLTWLKKAIAEQYPDHTELPETADPLERELDRQDTMRFKSADGYIPRPAEEASLRSCLESSDSRKVILEAEAGCGKTSLLASLITAAEGPVYYRFVGTTPQSFRLEDLSVSLVTQWVRDGLLSKDSLAYSPGELTLMFPRLCVEAAQSKPFLLVLDGMDQLPDNQNWLRWLPESMPERACVIVSVRKGSTAFPQGTQTHPLGLITDSHDKALMVSGYLSSFLKDLDSSQMNRLLEMDGSSNPLYMKIVLNELRQHGSFDTLMSMFQKDYGTTPSSAFHQVLLRISEELKNTFFSPAYAEFLFFMCLAHARQGLTADLFLTACRSLQGWTEEAISDSQILDLIYGLAREMEPYLILDGGQIAIRYDSLRRAIIDRYDPITSQQANLLLSQAYLWRLHCNHDPEDAVIALDHILLATEDFIYTILKRGKVLLLLLQWGGAILLAKACSRLVRQRGFRDFGDLEKVLSKAAARLDTNPDTLFLELDRYGDHGNPITAALLSQEKDMDTGTLLRPRYQADAYRTLSWELSHPEPSSGCTIWAEPYYAIISADILRVMDMRSRETVNILHLPKRQSDQTYLLAGGGDILHLCLFSHKHSRVQISSYRLPDLTLHAQTPILDCPNGNPWVLHDHSGQVYAMQFQNSVRSDHGIYTVSCMNTGRLIFRKELPTGSSYALKGSWFIFRDPASGDLQVFSLEDGKCVFTDRFLGTDHLDPNLQLTSYGKLFANTGNLYCACGEKLYLWLSGSRISASGQIELLQRMIRLRPTPEGLAEDRRWEQPVAHHSSFEVLRCGHLISESRGVVTVMDADCHSLGLLTLGTAPNHIHHGSTTYAEFDGQLLIFQKDKVRSYDWAAFLDALSPSVEQSFVGKRSTVIDNGFLYVMNPEMERIHLRTLKRSQEPQLDQQFWEIYAPWNMVGNDLWIGWGTKSGYFSIKKPGSLQRMHRCRIPDPDTRELHHAFLFRDQKDILQVGIIVGSKNQTQRLCGKETRGFSHLWLQTKPFSRLSFSGGWSETDTGIEIPVFNVASPTSPITVTVDRKPYLIFFNGYKDQQTVQVRIYDFLEQCWIYTKDLHLEKEYMLSDMNLLPWPGGILYSVTSQENPRLEIVDLTLRKNFVISQPLNILTKDPMAQEIILLNRDTREILSYDIRQQTLTAVTTLDSDFWPTQAALLRDKLILMRSFQDTVRIYRRSDGKLLCQQRLEVVPSDLLADNETNTLVMVDADCRKFFWQLEGRSS